LFREIAESLRERPVTEFALKTALRSIGITVPEGVVCTELPGNLGLSYPLVLKVSSAEILHKTEAGGVMVGIQGRGELEDKFRIMKERFPDSEIMIEEMINGGIEGIVGVSRDRNFGLSIMLGSGGIYTELFQDVTFRLIPIDETDALEMIGEVSLSKFVNGFRGLGIDKAALAKFLLRVSGLAGAMGDYLSQLDLNPIRIDGHRITVLDAKLIKRQSR
jgi:hypothetical protein